MEEMQIFKVVEDQQPGDLPLKEGSLDLAGDIMSRLVVVIRQLHLEQVGLDLACNVVGGFVVVWQEHRGLHYSRRRCPDVR